MAFFNAPDSIPTIVASFSIAACNILVAVALIFHLPWSILLTHHLSAEILTIAIAVSSSLLPLRPRSFSTCSKPAGSTAIT